MITKYVLVIWLGMGQSQTVSVQSYDIKEECDAVAAVLEKEMDAYGWYKCFPYTFNGSK